MTYGKKHSTLWRGQPEPVDFPVPVRFKYNVRSGLPCWHRKCYYLPFVWLA